MKKDFVEQVNAVLAGKPVTLDQIIDQLSSEANIALPDAVRLVTQTEALVELASCLNLLENLLFNSGTMDLIQALLEAKARLYSNLPEQETKNWDPSTEYDILSDLIGNIRTSYQV